MGHSTPLKLNNSRFRHIYENTPTATPLVSGTDADYGKKLPWLTFYKRSDDLLQVRLSTTIAYTGKFFRELRGIYYKRISFIITWFIKSISKMLDILPVIIGKMIGHFIKQAVADFSENFDNRNGW